MEKVAIYRVAIDSLIFILQKLPADVLADSSRIVLKKILSDCMQQIANEYKDI